MFDGFYKYTMAERAIAKFHTTATPVTFTEGQPAVFLPTPLIDLHCLIYDDTVLSHLGLRELESLRNGWRNVRGSPVAYTTQATRAKVVEVYPVPFETSPPIIPIHGLPLGADYVPGNGIAIYEQQQLDDCLPYLVLPIALICLAREYKRISDHTDMALGTMCREIGEALVQLLSDIFTGPVQL